MRLSIVWFSVVFIFGCCLADLILEPVQDRRRIIDVHGLEEKRLSIQRVEIALRYASQSKHRFFGQALQSQRKRLQLFRRFLRRSADRLRQ